MTANNIDNRHIRVFISSTFNDMQSERDELVSKIFPILRKKAAERNVTVTDIDLRWGITEEESRNGKPRHGKSCKRTGQSPFPASPDANAPHLSSTKGEGVSAGNTRRISYISSSIRSNLKITGRVPSLQHVIITFSSLVQPRMMEPPCNAAYKDSYDPTGAINSKSFLVIYSSILRKNKDNPFPIIGK